MNCEIVQNSLSAHLDRQLPAAESLRVQKHLSGCNECESRLAQMVRIRSAMKQLPVTAPPPYLSSALRVIASQERNRRLGLKHPVEYYIGRFTVWADNLMRPLALPFAGGVLSAIVLFSMLVPTMAARRGDTVNDVPVALFTEPQVKAQTPFGVSDDDIDVAVWVDGQGRMIDYEIVRGAVAKNSALRREIENNLLFTEFTPATAWGLPTSGKISLSFRRLKIEVKS